MLVEIGLLLVTVSWAIQLYETKFNNTNLDIKFVLLYTVGVFILAIDGLISNNFWTGFLNAAICFIALAAGAFTLKR
ncbi:MAG: hypothetical protein NTU61_00020 [Candidatus Altiarchaeota archaeon]|nr:hypothetical protein [Candidatus Altiarchaeota archaeon]